ncbi:MAG: hypothetical protein NZT92_03980 [Abditibacteriales bacterium]|nr:hypothetical protein [Abditibacteriales bacterium]MDW8365105.1 hypothetical protein [Abditibacteriales bacterium]
MKRLRGVNVVVAANQFNPSMFSQIWLVNNGIFDQSVFEQQPIPPDRFVFLPVCTQVKTDDMELLVVHERLQLSLSEAHLNAVGYARLQERIKMILLLVPHTPFTGMGFNFEWLAAPDGEEVNHLLRRTFVNPQSSFFALFDPEKSGLGTFVVTEWEGAKLTVQVKPVRLKDASGEQKAIHFDFNYHYDYPTDGSVQFLVRQLGLFQSALGHSETVVDSLLRG